MIVTNASGVHAALVADYVFGVLVMLQWGFPAAPAPAAGAGVGLPVHEPLAGKTLGIVGLGSIGAEIARRAPALRDAG